MSIVKERLPECCCIPAVVDRQRTVIVKVATLGRVSVPPGPKVTVPVGWKTAFEVPAAGVTLMITVMVDTGMKYLKSYGAKLN